ncbi:hypothetical protein HYT45_00305 [Candidatus Uhrbacteria bacterium]|nr:hypothetical protein [Candidatus Uhrbacteria bacterium]
MRQIDPKLADLTDEELERVRADLYDLAQLAFDVWYDEKNGSKNPAGTFPLPEGGDTV